MDLSQEQLDKIKELAGNFMNIEEIALIMDLDPDPFITEVTRRRSSAWKSYKTGIAESKNAIRQREIEMAKHGSPQAVQQADKYMTEQNLFDAHD